MKNNIDTIYNELKIGIDRKRLKEISVEIISKYKEKDIGTLSWYAALLNINTSDININRLFSQIIQNYHPDKFEKIINDINKYYAADNIKQLLRIKEIYLFSESIKREFVDTRDEEYFFDRDAGRYYETGLFDDEIVLDDEYDNIFDEYVIDQEYGFVEAVNNLFFGNLNHFITKSDLVSFDEELDLSGYDIVDLKGAENCVNIRSMNLSGNKLDKINDLSELGRLESLYLAENNIKNIDCLEGLKSLRELDISFNDIRDISVLKKLDGLRYVNILGNPVEDDGTIGELTDRGVVVIY